MKPAIYIFVSILILSCNKNNSLVIVPPGTQPQDSAKLIFITSTIGTTGDGFIMAYGSKKEKRWEIPSYVSINFLPVSAYFNNSLLIGKQYNSELHSHNAINGSLNWSFTSYSRSLTYGLLTSRNFNNDTIATAASTLTLWTPDHRNTLLLLNKQTGSVIWSKPMTEQSLIAPILNNTTIYNVTTNSNGTQTSLTAYDVHTKNVIWQKALSFSFLMSVPSGMIIKNDTLIVGSGTNTINVLNKNNGGSYWSKNFNAKNTFLYKNKIVYNDIEQGRVTQVNLQNGEIVLQSAPINSTIITSVHVRSSEYIYNDAFYSNIRDTLYCTNLLDGSLKWKKWIPNSSKFITIGDKVYCMRSQNNTPKNDSKLMILSAGDFIAKDSLIVPQVNNYTFSILSSADEFYF